MRLRMAFKCWLISNGDDQSPMSPALVVQFILYSGSPFSDKESVTQRNRYAPRL
jgi:hypothetical protein